MNQACSQADFREAMSRLLAAVNVITTDGPAGRFGMTASAICSVTDTPPTVLVCVNQKSSAHEAIVQNGMACVNVLRSDQEALARDFAGFTALTHAERFSDSGWQRGDLGLPMLSASLASLEGRVVNFQTVGSHSVFFIEVQSIHLSEQGAGLAWFARAFHHLGHAASAVAPAV